MSWLILETARPRSARCFCSPRVFCSCCCMPASSRSATPDLVGAGLRDDDAAGIVGRLREGQHRARHGADRPDHDPVDRGIDERGGNQRNQQRQQRDVARIDQHGVAQLVVRQDRARTASHCRRPCRRRAASASRRRTACRAHRRSRRTDRSIRGRYARRPRAASRRRPGAAKRRRRAPRWPSRRSPSARRSERPATGSPARPATAPPTRRRPFPAFPRASAT